MSTTLPWRRCKIEQRATDLPEDGDIIDPGGEGGRMPGFPEAGMEGVGLPVAVSCMARRDDSISWKANSR